MRRTIPALALAIATLTFTSLGASAQEVSLADHPLTGVWLGTTHWPEPRGPEFAGPGVFGADGSVQLFFPVGVAGEQGLQFTTAAAGTWEAEGERGGHFTAVQSLSNPDGTFAGTVTIDGHPLVSEDGLTLLDDGSQVIVTIRDAEHNIVNTINGGPPVTGTRMNPGSPGFPEASPAAASPAP